MENSIKQVRVRFPGFGQDGQNPTTIRERRIPPQKTSSLKRERKKNWFQRLFSSTVSRDPESSDGGEFAASVAATVLAINSLEEEELQKQKMKTEQQETTVAKAHSKKDSATATGPREAGRVSKRFSDDSSVKKSEGVDRRMTDIATTNAKVPEKIVSRVPTIKKSPTLADQILIETQSMKPGSSIDTKPAPTPPPRRKPTLSTDQDEKLKENSTKPGSRGAGAIAWEKAEMAKIRKRYEQMKNQILLWEDEKKRKAKRRLDRKEGKLERRRQRALQHFSNETAKINQIAQAARENMERQRKKEESEVKEKANKIRSTGKVPVTCFCF